jgi:membrane-bound lytic murein transglycosylase B
MPQLELTAAGYLSNTDEPLRFVAAFDDPATPAQLAAVLRETERYVRTGGNSDTRIHAAHRSQRAYRQLGSTPAWRDEVFAELPDDLRFIARKNVEAHDALVGLRGDSPPSTTLPAWRILAPAPASDLLAYYREAGEALVVDWEILAAINLIETRMGRIEGFSTAGARGPMQFIPASWDAFGGGGDIDDPRDAIFAAARHLTQRPGNPPSDASALLRYNNHAQYGVAVLAYANVLRAAPDAYLSYHSWQVYYATEADDHLLPVGYAEPNPVPAEEYLGREAVPVAH